jgi:hypothetical protein
MSEIKKNELLERYNALSESDKDKLHNNMLDELGRESNATENDPIIRQMLIKKMLRSVSCYLKRYDVLLWEIEQEIYNRKRKEAMRIFSSLTEEKKVETINAICDKGNSDDDDDETKEWYMNGVIKRLPHYLANNLDLLMEIAMIKN